MKVYLNQVQLDQYIKSYRIADYFSDFDYFYKYLKLVRFSKNDVVYKDKETLDYIYFFLSGKLKVCNNLSNGKSLLLCFFEGFEILGDLELYQIASPSNSITVIKESYCVAIPVKDERVKGALLKDVKFLNFLSFSLAKKLVTISEVSSANILCTLQNRLAKYIYYLSEKNTDKSSAYNRVFRENLTETAELLGTSYRHLLRILQQYVQEGILEKREDCYVIKDIGRLKLLSSDSYV
ncbi:MAG TPA: cyclic nucleotide-binding domain-containing protein [Clostridiales bacterium]|nr:cyclic nucleotide-binding domain-containing protein [Clostridiales bacterium]